MNVGIFFIFVGIANFTLNIFALCSFVRIQNSGSFVQQSAKFIRRQLLQNKPWRKPAVSVNIGWNSIVGHM